MPFGVAAPTHRTDQDGDAERHRALSQCLAGRRDPQCRSRAAPEPVAHVCDKRREKGAGAQKTGDKKQPVELPQGLGMGGGEHTKTQYDGADQAHPAGGGAIRHPAHHDSAQRQSQQAGKIDQRHRAALPAELLMQRNEEHRDAVDHDAHADRQHDGGSGHDHPPVSGFGPGVALHRHTNSLIDQAANNDDITATVRARGDYRTCYSIVWSARRSRGMGTLIDVLCRVRISGCID